MKEHYKIYTLIIGMYAFVGKTKAKKMKPILWRHLRGENIYTWPYFVRGLPDEPRMYILEQVYADASLAYRYEIAFIRILLDEGYCAINSPGMLKAAKDIHPFTGKILESLKSVPLQKRLQMGDIDEVKVPSDAEHPKKVQKKERTEVIELASEMVTFRATPTEKKNLVDYADRLGISQRKAVQLLLAKQVADEQKNGNVDDYLRDFFKVYREDKLLMEQEIARLKEEIRILRRKEKVELKEREKMMRQGITEFFGFFESEMRGNPELEQDIYRTFTEQLDDQSPYHYPDQEGIFLFYPEKILLGKGRFAPLFIVGENEEGHKICLRFYPKKYYTGLRFTNKSFGLKNSAWLVGVERARDEAMDVIFALPVDIQLRMAGTIDDLIRNAENQLEYDDWFV